MVNIKKDFMKVRQYFLIVVSCFSLHNTALRAEDNNTAGYEKVKVIEGYARMIAAVVCKMNTFFTREEVVYDLQKDVLDHPVKQMVYRSTQDIEQLFIDANQYDNPIMQIRALILLCRTPVPEWYFKSFQKGLDTLVNVCFDEQGNFIHAAHMNDIRFIFKDYYRKTPSSWQHIARISDWYCRNKKPYPLYTKYFAFTCTDHNEELLALSKALLEDDTDYIRYLVHKNGSKIAYKLYDYYLFCLSKHDNNLDVE